jgi:hypothetical protein
MDRNGKVNIGLLPKKRKYKEWKKKTEQIFLSGKRNLKNGL